MPSGLCRRNDQPQRSSPPAPPPMPPGRSRRNDRPQRSSPPPPPPMPPGPSHLCLHPRSVGCLSDEVEVLSNLRTRPRYPPPTRASEYQRAPEQTATPNPGPSREQYIQDLLNKAVTDRKLELSQSSARQIKHINNCSQRGILMCEDKEPHVSFLNELVDTTKLDKSIITNASSSLLQSPSCEDTDQAVNHDTIKVSSPSSQNTPPVYSLKPMRLNFQYYARVDNRESVHTYPALTGPFKSLKDAQDAINSHHAEQCKMMCMKGLSKMERGIRRALYWPNGLRRNSAEALAFMKNLRPEVELVRALLDKYNEDNNLSGDLLYELIKVVGCEPIHDRNGSSNRLYYHFNLVIRTKEADDPHGRSNNLYFAEVARMNGKFEESVLTFFHKLKLDDNGECFECWVDMKHPNDVEYKRGRPRIPMPGGMCPDESARAYMEEFVAVYDEAELKAQEARVRKEFKELYHPGFAAVQKYIVPARRQVQTL